MSKVEQERLALSEYWDEKYTAEGSDKPFDWFRDFHSLNRFLEKHLSDRDARLIHLGCGNSVIGAPVSNNYPPLIIICYNRHYLIASTKRATKTSSMLTSQK